MNTTNQYKQKISADRVIVITCLSVVLGLAGCQKEGTAEKAGKKIDRAAENAEQNIEQATEKVGEKIDRAAENVEKKYDLATTKADQKIEAAKESLDKKVDKAQEAINESTEASKETLEKTGMKIDLATEKLESKVGSVKESVVEKAKTAGAYVDDAVITTKVKTAILNEPMLNASHIEVTTDKGVVTLSGTVDSEPSIGRAMEVASSQKNVKSVKTDLIVNVITPSK